MKKQLITLLILAIYALSLDASAKKIVFYEAGTQQYSIQNDYSKLAEELRKKSYEVATIEKGDITKDKLENYDILIIMNPSKQFTTDEITAIIWFVLQKGRGLFIMGGGQGKANQLTIIFGVTVDNGILIDAQNQIPALKDRSSFIIDNFYEYPLTRILKQGVSKVGVYKTAGLYVSGTSMCVASGNPSTYSDTGSFSAGVQPCVAAASRFGGGLAFTLSDPEMLSNKYIDDYNNKAFGHNIIDWLGIPSEVIPVDELNNTDYVLQIKDMRLQNMRMDQQINQLNIERKVITDRYSQCSVDLEEVKVMLDESENSKIMGLDRQNWVIIVLGVCILMAAIFYSTKKKSTDINIKDEDILNELGYELEGEKPSDAAQEKK
ncbi:MAG: DUF4350 domain-containing protein [Candidatus Altiarchaeota archaeon]